MRPRRSVVRRAAAFRPLSKPARRRRGWRSLSHCETAARESRRVGASEFQPRRLLGPPGTGSQQMRRPPPREERRRRGSLSRRCRVGTAAARSTAWCRTAASPGESGSDAGEFASFRGFGGSALGRCCVVRWGCDSRMRRFCVGSCCDFSLFAPFCFGSFARRGCVENRMRAAISLFCVRRVSSGDGGN